MQGIKENSTSVVTPIHLAGIEWMKVARLVLLSRALDRYEVEKLAPQGKVKYQFSAGFWSVVYNTLSLYASTVVPW